MKGDIVLVRALSGALERRVVEDTEDLVLIASPEQYDLRERGLTALDPVPFPRRFVYRYDADIAARLAVGEGETAWNAAEPY